MTKRKSVGLVVLLLCVGALLYGCTQFLAFSDDANSVAYPKDASGRAKVLIGFREHPKASDLAAIRGLGGEVEYVYDLVPAVAAAVPGASISGLRGALGARYVEPDGPVSALDLTSELNNTWGVKHIGAGDVQNGGTTGAGVKVAIIDTGIDYTHPELAASFNHAFGYDYVNHDTDPMDDNGHGTHVAGTVAAARDGTGVVGVAPGASLIAYKVLDKKGSGSWSNVIAAIDQAVKDGALVINMSLGGGKSTTLEQECSAAYSAGVVLVAAAGNSGNRAGKGDNVNAPAVYSASVIAVAATDSADKRASWSSTGSAVELAAPGVNIVSTRLGGGYTTMSGTSMAAPHVAGTVALVTQSGVTGPASIRSRLDSTAHDLGAVGWDSRYGYGLVDAKAACGIP